MRRYLSRMVVMMALPALFAPPHQPILAQAPGMVQAPIDTALGRHLFVASCGRCHGFAGTGELGPPLTRPVLRAAPTDSILERIIQNGIPGTSMPGAAWLSENDARRIAAYVRTLGRVAPEPIAGDATRGRVAYDRAGCASCHTIDRRGGVVGPDLTTIGARRSVSYIRQSILDPSASLADDGGFVQYLVVRAVTRDGRPITGVRINEDGFTIQLRDAQAHFFSFRKSALRSLERDFRASLMPSYRQLSEREIEDIVAYLATRAGTGATIQ